MADSTFNITANTTGSGIKIAAPNANRKTNWHGTIMTYGALGGGTVALFLSPDNGTTLVALKTTAGTPYTATANDYITFTTGAANQLNGRFSVWAQVAGATGANINISVFDNV